MTTQRDLDILLAEAEAEVEAEWQEFLLEFMAERAPQDVANGITGQVNTEVEADSAAS